MQGRAAVDMMDKRFGRRDGDSVYAGVQEFARLDGFATTKQRQRYGRQGVECWIVDLDSRLVERWGMHDARPQVLTDMVTWQPEGTTVPLTISLAELFAESLGES